MRFKIGEKTYQSQAIDDISLRDLVLFNAQAADLGIEERWGDVEELMRSLEDLDEDAVERHPQKFLVMAVTVWMARRGAGEDVTFGQALDIPMSQIDILPDPEDHKPGKPKGAKKPRKSTKASGPAESPAEDADEPTTSAPQESASESTPA